MINVKKWWALGALVLALTLGATAVSASELPEPAGAICYLETLTDSPYIQSLTRPSLYVAENGEFAESLAAWPVDVTPLYSGTNGIPIRATRGYAFRITLQEGACWEDGRALNAAHIVDAIHSRLEEYPWIASAEEYLSDCERPAQEIISLEEAGFSSLTQAREAGYSRFYINLAGFWGLEDAGWTDVKDRQRILDPAMMPGLDEMYVTADYLFHNYLEEGAPLSWFQSKYAGVAAQREPMTAEDVCVIRMGEREILILTDEPMTADALALKIADVTALRGDFQGSYGPYRIADEGADEIRLDRNPHWTGNDSAYPADVIRCISR